MIRRHMLIGFWSIVLISLLLAGTAAAQDEEKKKDKPARGVVASLLYPGLSVGPDDSIRVDLVVKNTGRSNETVLLEVTEKPEGWKAQIKDYGNVVTGVFLAEDEDRTLTFTAEPEKGGEKLPPGQYEFKVTAQTPDGTFKQTSDLTVTVVAEQKAKESLKLTTSYPVLRGPSDAQFEFTLDVSNESDEDGLFNLQATAPEGWEVYFKPAYEEKQISSLQINARQNRSVGVHVIPPRQVEAQEYPIKIKVSSAKGKAQAEAELTVALTGTYKVELATPNDLLSVSTQKGQTANMSVYVKNSGSAVQKQITFVSFKPENWKVEFEPEKIENLKGEEFKQAEIKITPSEDALVGDYSVIVTAQGEKATDDVEFRVTVKASSAWGWIGVGIIVLVIVGLALTFKALGRR
ncbi:MAG: NEW3 domain-containing protein [Thermodesulfobacteriota bacterium]